MVQVGSQKWMLEYFTFIFLIARFGLIGLQMMDALATLQNWNKNKNKVSQDLENLDIKITTRKQNLNFTS